MSGLWVAPDESELVVARVGLREADLMWLDLAAETMTQAAVKAWLSGKAPRLK